MKTRCIATAIAALFLSFGAAHARTWKSSDGTKTFEGEVKTYSPETGKVTVTLVNGKDLTFTQDKLSADDIAFLKEKGTIAPTPAAAETSSSEKAASVPTVIPDPDGKPADMTKPVQVFILLGQSNMVGLGKIETLDAPIKTQGKFPYLVDDAGAWTVRQDVRNVFIMSLAPQHNDWMSMTNRKNLGPEHGIGHALGSAIDAPVMVLKSCIGNRSLGWDLLPPGSKSYEAGGKTIPGYREYEDGGKILPYKPGVSKVIGTKGKDKGKEVDPWYAGKQYDDDVQGAKLVLADLDKHYPGAKAYEVAGFLFWQGEKDGGSAENAARYELNLVNFIKALRKDFDAPNAKFVLATLGEATKGSSGNGGLILDAQLAVDGESGKYPEFKGNVATVYANPLSMGGSGNGHYSGNGETYMNVGEAMGRTMAGLLVR